MTGSHDGDGEPQVFLGGLASSIYITGIPNTRLTVGPTALEFHSVFRGVEQFRVERDDAHEIVMTRHRLFPFLMRTGVEVSRLSKPDQQRVFMPFRVRRLRKALVEGAWPLRNAHRSWLTEVPRGLRALRTR